MTNKQNIFIHIPKTGGTTINCAMHNTAWQTQPNFNYRHIIFENKCSNSADIFNPLENDQYLDFTVFMILRNPIDRLLSEYYFLKDRKEFISLIKPKPRNLTEYVKSKATQNYMVGFLVGKRIFPRNFVTEKDYQLVINAIEKLDIHVGVFEQYPETMEYLGKETGIKWPKTINVKRITLNRPKLETVDEATKELIKKHNPLDFKLYDYCVQRFEEKTAGIRFKNKINFHSNKYDYVIKYTQRFNLLELGMKNKTFIQGQSSFFKAFNEHLHHVARLHRGEDYVINWNSFFIQSMTKYFPDTVLVKELKALKIEEPLEKTMAICQRLNQHLDGMKLKAFCRKKMRFDPADFTLIKEEKASVGFIARLFGKR